MARQCMVAAISRQSNAESLASIRKDLYQLATSAILVDESAEKVKCESLERVTVDNDPERFFEVGSELPLRERGGGIDWVSERKC